MPAYLLTWNPQKWSWTDLDSAAKEVRRNGFHEMFWSCGNTTRIRAGDRVFLLRQGKEPRGLVASGHATDEPDYEPHWDDTEPPTSETLFVGVRWDVIETAPVIPREELDRPPFTGMHWNTQKSGISIAPDIARELEKEWMRRVRARRETRSRKS